MPLDQTLHLKSVKRRRKKKLNATSKKEPYTRNISAVTISPNYTNALLIFSTKWPPFFRCSYLDKLASDRKGLRLASFGHPAKLDIQNFQSN